MTPERIGTFLGYAAAGAILGGLVSLGMAGLVLLLLGHYLVGAAFWVGALALLTWACLRVMTWEELRRRVLR